MTEFNRPTPEDEAFNDIERISRIRQEIIRRQMEPPQTRNNIIEEVALHVEKLKGFGKDTVDSLAVYIREMKTIGRKPTSELHSCPYAEEIHGNYEKVCDCDEERTRQCAQDI